MKDKNIVAYRILIEAYGKMESNIKIKQDKLSKFEGRIARVYLALSEETDDVQVLRTIRNSNIHVTYRRELSKLESMKKDLNSLSNSLDELDPSRLPF